MRSFWKLAYEHPVAWALLTTGVVGLAALVAIHPTVAAATWLLTPVWLYRLRAGSPMRRYLENKYGFARKTRWR